jgi:carboxyl-terminal processing protease
MLEITIAALKDPAYLTWVPPASPTAEQVRMRRVASFARLWSEIKYNFVFLHERKDVDWDSMLEQFLPRVMAAESSEQYVETLKEAVALLADGHTSVQGGAVVDRPPVRIEPVGGRPVLTAFADVPELQGVPLQRGMELLSVDGEPVDSLRRRLARTVAASTPQSRARTVDWMLLQGPLNSTATAVFRATDGSVVSAQLKRNQTSIPAKALPWRKGSFEYRELPGGIAYVALNSFGNDSAVKGFDEHFDRILQSSGLIIDVRENGGGSSGHGYSVVARLIEKGVKLKTTAWRTRNYKPALRAWGQPEEWHEGTHGEIEARGETPYRGPVMVLIGPDTFSAAEDFLAPLKISKRATLIGTPTGGSTGQPLFVPLFQASARICTKWDRFADGTEFVGLGVQPDVVVETTRADIALGRDPVLAKAQELLAAGTR